MNDSFDADERAIDRIGIANIGDVKVDRLECGDVLRGMNIRPQRVENADLMTARQKPLQHMAADESGSASQEYLHA